MVIKCLRVVCGLSLDAINVFSKVFGDTLLASNAVILGELRIVPKILNVNLSESA